MTETTNKIKFSNNIRSPLCEGCSREYDGNNFCDNTGCPRFQLCKSCLKLLNENNICENPYCNESHKKTEELSKKIQKEESNIKF